MANSIPERIQSRLNSLAQFYAQDLYDRAYQVLRAKRYRNSGALLDSLKVTWFKATEQWPPRILLIYNEYAQLFEQRSLSWVNTPPIEDLKEWIRHKGGSSAFGTVPGYRDGMAGSLPEYKKVERIAWAIATDKRVNDTHKRRPWKRKTLREMLIEMNQETQKAFANEAEQLMKEALQGEYIQE